MAEALLRASPGVALLATSREPREFSASTSTGSRRSMCRRKTTRTWKMSSGTARSGSSCRGPMPPSHGTWPRAASRRRRPPFAGASTDSARDRARCDACRSVGCRWRGRPPGRPLQRSSTGGSRMALPRHQTLRATLDWSYELRSESERVVLRRLGVFVGAFTLDAASAVSRWLSTSLLRRWPIRSRIWWASHSCRRMWAARLLSRGWLGENQLLVRSQRHRSACKYCRRTSPVFAECECDRCKMEWCSFMPWR